MKEGEMAQIRGNEFGFVYQSFNLFENLNVYENITLPFKINGRKTDKEMIDSLIAEIGLEKLIKKKICELSGGEQQRVAIARAMVMNPGVLFADEPTGNLDSENTAIVSDLFYKINNLYKTMLVIVSHDKAFMNDNSCTLVLKDGIIENEK